MIFKKNCLGCFCEMVLVGCVELVILWYEKNFCLVLLQGIGV